MSGIAELFHRRGFRVSGSDVAASETTQKLQEIGIEIHIGHRAQNVDAARVVVVSSAIRPTNPEVLEAQRRRIPVIPRAEMLGELMRGKIGLAVAGTHGKTTTTSMLGAILTEAGWDPTLVIGGKVDSLGGSNAKAGLGEYVVAEADESDGSFLHLPATYAVVTNIDSDHLDHFGSLAAIEAAFVDFVGKIPFYGTAVVCGEDVGVQRCLGRFTKPYRTYGFSPEWDYWATSIEVDGVGSRFDLCAHNGKLGSIHIAVPGQHNVLNSLAAAALALEIGVDFKSIQAGLNAYLGVQRRFEVKWKSTAGGLWVVDDYAHHPTEIAATIQAARRFWKGKITAVFQPHRYSRTLHSRDGFLSAFGDVDAVYITDIYAAGEEPIPGVSAQGLVAEMQSRSAHPDSIRWISRWEDLVAPLVRSAQEGDLILCLGAGSITRLSGELARGLSQRPQVGH